MYKEDNRKDSKYNSNRGGDRSVSRGGGDRNAPRSTRDGGRNNEKRSPEPKEKKPVEEKQKPEKKKIKLTPEEIKEKTISNLKEFLGLYVGVSDELKLAPVMSEAVQCFREMELDEYSCVPERCLDIILESSTKDADKRMSLFKLIKELKTQGILTVEAALAGTARVFSFLDDIKIDAPKADEYFGSYLGFMHVEDIVSLSNINKMVVDAVAENEYSMLIKGTVAADTVGFALRAIEKFADTKTSIDAAKSIDMSSLFDTSRVPDYKVLIYKCCV